MRRVFDLHCDLLYYLAFQSGRTPLQSTSRCALHQLRDGGVDLQVLPIFSMGGPDSTAMGLAQARRFEELTTTWEAHFRRLSPADDLALTPEAPPGEGRIGVIAAVENASSFCGADEPLKDGLARLDELEALTGPLLYVSLTWRRENRFGGGDAVRGVGLKDDGRAVLDVLADKGVAIDLSHASDRLAEEILAYIDKVDLALTPIASHSNFRSVTAHVRNLPDSLAEEITRRGGVIGLNLVRGYVGETVEVLAAHLEHGLERGWGRQLVLGSDFFWEGDLPSGGKLGRHFFFFPGFEDASCHPDVQNALESRLDPGEGVLCALTSENLRRFLRRLWETPL